MYYYSVGEILGVCSVIALIAAIVATVLAFIFIVPEKRREKLNAFGRFLHDTFNFKYLIVEKILQALYIFLTGYVILIGFFMLFQTTPSYYGIGGKWLGGYGILIMILGPVIIRLIYELLMMTVILVKNVISINSKIKNSGNSAEKNYFAAPDLSDMKADIRQRMNAGRENNMQPENTVKHDVVSFCSDCGTRLDENGVCPQCGNDWK